jgi:hypothetical protein
MPFSLLLGDLTFQRNLLPPSTMYNESNPDVDTLCRRSGQLEQVKGEVLKATTLKEGP